MSTYTKQLQNFLKEYEKSGMSTPVTAREVAEWAIKNNLWKPRPADIIEQCTRDIAKAWREEYRTDKYGRRYRAKHAVRLKDDKERQMTLWADMDTAPRSYMETAFSQRRRHVVGECHQLKTDVDCYNDKNPENEPINLILDFTEDVEELEYLEKAS